MAYRGPRRVQDSYNRVQTLHSEPLFCSVNKASVEARNQQGAINKFRKLPRDSQAEDLTHSLIKRLMLQNFSRRIPSFRHWKFQQHVATHSKTQRSAIRMPAAVFVLDNPELRGFSLRIRPTCHRGAQFMCIV